MDFHETNIQSFIVKLWLEEAPREGKSATWRGLITHVPSGASRSVQTLEGIGLFILPYLRHMGVRTSWRWRLLRRLEHKRQITKAPGKVSRKG